MATTSTSAAGSARRRLVGWNAIAWLYLAGVAITLVRADSGHIKRLALAQAESAAVALAIVVVAAMMSLVALIVELLAAKAAGPQHMLPHLIFAFVSVVGSWLLLPMVFGLTYAAAYYGPEPDRGLVFPRVAERASSPITPTSSTSPSRSPSPRRHPTSA